MKNGTTTAWGCVSSTSVPASRETSKPSLTRQPGWRSTHNWKAVATSQTLPQTARSLYLNVVWPEWPLAALFQLNQWPRFQFRAISRLPLISWLYHWPNHGRVAFMVVPMLISKTRTCRYIPVANFSKKGYYLPARTLIAVQHTVEPEDISFTTDLRELVTSREQSLLSSVASLRSLVQTLMEPLTNKNIFSSC